MDVPVRLSSGLAQSAGNSRLQISLHDGATVADLYASLRTRYPQMEQNLESAVAVVAGRHVSPSEALIEGQEVALLIPISGGAPAELSPSAAHDLFRQ